MATRKPTSRGSRNCPTHVAPLDRRQTFGHDPSSPHSLLLALQRSAGNRAVSGLVRGAAVTVQRLPMRGFPKGPVADVQVSKDGETVGPVTLNTVREIVPAGHDPGTFQGFTEQLPAAVVGMRTRQVSVVLRETSPDGNRHYHAFETDLPLLPTPFRGALVPFELGTVNLGPPAGRVFVEVVGWGRISRPGDPHSWESKASAARAANSGYLASKLADSRDKADQLYVDLLADTLDLHRHRVRSSTGGQPVPGMVNFDLDLDTDGVTRGGKVIADRATPLPPPATVSVGPLAFKSAAELEGTVTHELTHAEHANQAARWVRRWRHSGSKKEFGTWLAKRVGHHLDGLTAAMVLEEVGQTVKGGRAVPTGKRSSGTEVLGYLTTFVSSYHRIDPALGGITGGPADSRLFGSLGELAEEWPWAGRAAQNAVLATLADYYRNELDEPHQRRLTDYARRRLVRPEKGQESFWKALAGLS